MTFAAYWLGSLFGNLGFQMQSAALFWQVYDLTGSTLDIAFIGLAEFAPSLLAGRGLPHRRRRHASRRDRHAVRHAPPALEPANAPAGPA